MSAGKFISLEGIEGAGKSTLARALQSALRARGLSVVLTREPGGTALAERLRAIVLERASEHINAQAETLIMFAARAIHLDNLIRPALAAGSWVICDRFTDATRAYQGAGRGVSASVIDAVAAAVHADLWPDRTLILDLPVEQGLRRVRQRQDTGDRFEDESQRFFERVRNCYLSLAAAEAMRIRVIDATLTPELVTQSAIAAIEDMLPGGSE